MDKREHFVTGFYSSSHFVIFTLRAPNGSVFKLDGTTQKSWGADRYGPLFRVASGKDIRQYGLYQVSKTCDHLNP